ncbi:M1 family metallopeptidase [Fulvivirgaceae bacterium PWU4]|uniref:M1 family metallopeptidase n=1 Tax=Chryseosolibacter histidini TaxID=2782349 RepID=A0AAP2DRU3_9BACT|nr:M1 family metallopeptidase [Chryseosolibacter histidini]MBT1700153.1 M1 family metallopeptidase [Chryseosolibacter histidini]
MRYRLSILLIFGVLQFSFAQQSLPQRKTIETDRRNIRLDVPLTNSIRKAFKDGTRDLSGKPGPNYWQLRTDYTILATLNPATQVIYGTEKIDVYNNSKEELTQILLRLDHNIFRSDVPRGFSTPAETTEGMVVTSLIIDGRKVDLGAIPSNDRNAPARLGIAGLNRTLATVTLNTPVKAGSKITLEIEWNTKLPGGPNGSGHRMTQRWENTLFQPTQWFPRVAKYDDLRGWETSVYLGPSEFYNNFGKFDVRITVPAGWLVSGTGLLQNSKEVLSPAILQRLANITTTDEEVTIVGESERGAGTATATGETLTWHFVADQVNDFAWATSRDFIWKATRANIPEKGYIPIHMFYLPARAGLFENAGKITRHALEFYSSLWAPYPFPQLTLQDGPSAGMEYPMVINSNQGAADHETAHQWWPMMVGNNETRYGWMDEGFNQFMNILSDADAEGKPYSLDGLGQRYGKTSGSENEAPMMWSANDAGPGYRFQTYGKAPLMLSMLGGMVGDEAVLKAMKAYTKAWSFKHPSPWDYMFFMNQALGQNLEWFWYYWLFTTESVDGSIRDVQSSRGMTRVVVHQAGQMPSPVVLKVEFEESGPAIGNMPNAKPIDKNTVIVTWPADVWFNGSRTFNADLTLGERKIKKITLDPYGRFPDAEVKDNVWMAK